MTEDVVAHLSRPEQVRSWKELAQEWTAESDHLTATLRLERRVVSEKFPDVVSALYAAGA